MLPFFDYFSYLENSLENFNGEVDDSILFRNWIDFVNNSIENDLKVIIQNANPNFKNFNSRFKKTSYFSKFNFLSWILN